MSGFPVRKRGEDALPTSLPCTVFDNRRMRWEELFADLQARWESALRAEEDAELPEIVRAERAAMSLDSRLAASLDDDVIAAVEPWTIAGRLDRVGSGWAMTVGEDGSRTIINTAAIDYFDRLSRTGGRQDAVTSRLTLGHVLRTLARDRAAVRLVLRGPRSTKLTGTIDAVGADYLDLAMHALDEPRRAGAVRGRRTLPFGAIGFIADG